ncbi:methylmalonyl-CoA mutase family protein [Haliea sp. E17]|uniref:methylmalonyl-CoA mutase family protein n=1 Tax=Haliea sp. E17 TaxID=3401576 RepID=UPI003AAE7D09
MSSSEKIRGLLCGISQTIAHEEAFQGNTSASAGLPLAKIYTASANKGEVAGEYPFTRGVTSNMYHDGHWVMGMYSGYGSPTETKKRFKLLLEAGQTGLSVALDLPTQTGVDSDDPLAKGEVGKVGVALNSVDDMIAMLDGLPLENLRQMRTTANAISPIFTAFTLVAMEELGIDPSSFKLLLQNDPLKEFTSRGTWIFPPAASIKFSVDVIEYFQEYYPSWQPIQFCGYHIRDAGGTATQEVGVSILNGLAYLDAAEARGVDISKISPTLFTFLAASVDIFEEAAKFRATRRLWAKILHERYGVPEEAATIRIFSYTLGGALTAQEPHNNIARIAYEALAAVLGGTQTLATSSWDEALSLPSEDAAHLSLRIQQIIGAEAGAAKVVDPLGGSYYVENLTDRLEAEIAAYVVELIDAGGAVKGIEDGSISAQLGESAYREYRDIAEGRKLLVGVNYKTRAAESNALPVATPAFPDATDEAMASLAATREKRIPERVDGALLAVELAARNDENTIPAIIEAARARATIGEICTTLAKVWGRHPVSQESI